MILKHCRWAVYSKTPHKIPTYFSICPGMSRVIIFFKQKSRYLIVCHLSHQKLVLFPN